MLLKIQVFYNFILIADNIIVKRFLLFVLFIFLILNLSYSQKRLSEINNQFDESMLNSIDSSNHLDSDEPSDFSKVEIPYPDAFIPSNDVPIIFDGIWEGDDRYIMFQEKSELEKIVNNKIPYEEKNYIWCYLKTFYGWYLDRAAEKTNRKNSSYSYDTNDTVFKDIQNISIQFRQLINSENCSAFELILTYPRVKEKTVIPVAIINNKLYLDFAIKTSKDNNLNDELDLNNQNPLLGSWSSIGKVSGIKISKPIVSDSLYSLYVTDECVYYIRYWKTDMEYSTDFASFSDGVQKYEVPKHIKSSGNVYTCVTGRSLVIRNVERKHLPLENYVMNDEKNVIAFGNPYLSKISERCSLENMMKIVKESNSRRAPMPPLPFEPSNLDWHIDDITKLELNNQIIQAVRKRQREFYEKYQLGLKY